MDRRTDSDDQRRRIVAFVPNELGTSPGQRCRIETWAPALRAEGWDVTFSPFEDASLQEVLYLRGHLRQKTARMASCFARQLRVARSRPACNVVLLYREASLIGPALIERLIARWEVPIIYDIDDPVFIPYRSPSNAYFSLLKCSRKTHALFRMSACTIAINRLIGDYAARFCPRVEVIPNLLDTSHYRPAAETPGSRDGLRLAWIGSVSTMGNLGALAEPLRRLQASHQAPLRVIGVGSADLPGVEHETHPWSAATEVELLQGCHVGLVPLADAPWNHWKFFLKVIQYMAVGLPVVAQRMGSNPEVIEDGVDGFLVETPEEWYARLAFLAEHPGRLEQMGRAAREKAVRCYSSGTQMSRVLALVESMSGTARPRSSL